MISINDLLYHYQFEVIHEPDIITTAKDDECEYYKMIYKVPSDYTLPKFLTFTFNEHCFGNKRSLTWDGKKCPRKK